MGVLIMTGEIALKKIVDADENMELDKVMQSVDNFLQTFLDAVRDDSINSFYKDVKSLSQKLEVVSDMFGIEDDLEKEKIYLISMLKAVILLAEKMQNQQETFDSSELKKYKYLYQMLGLILDNGAMPLKDIAEAIGVERHSLSNFIRRTSDYHLWTTRKLGKYNYYQITSKGELVYSQYMKEKAMKSNVSFEKTCNLIIEVLTEEIGKYNPDVNVVVQKINSQLGGTLIKSKYTKVQIQKLFAERNEYSRREIFEYYKCRAEISEYPKTEIFRKLSLLNENISNYNYSVYEENCESELVELY